MTEEQKEQVIREIPAVADAAALRETVWINDRKLPFREAPAPITDAQIQDAEDRLERFAPYIAAAFPETGDGLIESPFQEIPRMREWISMHEGTALQGRLFLKRDSDLAVSGSAWRLGRDFFGPRMITACSWSRGSGNSSASTRFRLGQPATSD